MCTSITKKLNRSVRLLRLTGPLFALTVILSTASCHSVVIVIGEEKPPVSISDAPPEPMRKERQASTAMGIIGLAKEPEPIVCRQQKPEVRIVTNFTDNAIHFFIGPFYTTRTVEIYCR